MNKIPQLNMDLMNEKKYPISKNKHQCIGPCYYENTPFVNPITGQYFTLDNPACPIYDEEIIDGKVENVYVDTCNKPTVSKTTKDESLEIQMALPFFALDTSFFLRKYYNIYSFEHAIEWLEKKKNSPMKTKNRVIECAWIAFGNEIDILDQRITNYYLDLIKKNWIGKIVSELEGYISIDPKSKTISIEEHNKKNINEKYRTEKTNYILEKFIDRDDIYKFLIKYIKYHQKTWDVIENHHEQILLDLIEYIKKKISISV
jgi:hypothetical protein